ncbi:hypothetical protein [Georgenia sp. Z1491]|uniref:hypothetical protein n=1 Tax=Georgenia sp. Z1491 TaxID=3416707 RepID=UPI003CF409B4
MRIRPTSSRAAAALAVTVGSLTLAACGGGDDESETSGQETPSDETATDAESASESETETEEPFDGPAVDITWPDEWEDLAPYISTTPEGAEVQAYGDPTTEYATSVVVMSFGESTVDGRSYTEILEEQGTDLAELLELPARDVDGTTVTPYERVTEADTGPVVQHLYPVELDDGGLVEITLVAEQTTFAGLIPVFEEILDSVVID